MCLFDASRAPVGPLTAVFSNPNCVVGISDPSSGYENGDKYRTEPGANERGHGETPSNCGTCKTNVVRTLDIEEPAIIAWKNEGCFR